MKLTGKDASEENRSRKEKGDEMTHARNGRFARLMREICLERGTVGLAKSPLNVTDG